MEEKNIDKNLYNEKALNLLNIRELRDLGRKFAVPSPTTKKKSDLIDYILKVVYGKVTPPARSAYGRPTQREFDMKKFVTKIKKNSDTINELKDYRLSYDDLNSDEYKFNFRVASPKNFSQIGEIKQRVVFKEGDNFVLREKQFINLPSDININKDVANLLNLENFDVVEIIETDEGIKIISKNGERISKKFEKFSICDESIIEGSRKVFHLRTKEEIEKNIEEIRLQCKKQGLTLLILKDSQQQIQDKNSDFVLNEEDKSKKYKQFIMFIEKCKKYVYENKNIIVVIQNRKDLEQLIDSFDEDISNRIKQHLLDDINNFVKLSNIIISFDLVGNVIY